VGQIESDECVEDINGSICKVASAGSKATIFNEGVLDFLDAATTIDDTVHINVSTTKHKTVSGSLDMFNYLTIFQLPSG
jgi:hypothetical protein